MGKETTATQTLDYVTQPYIYKTAENIQEIVSTLQSVTTTGCPQVALVTITLHFEHERRLSPRKQAQLEYSTRYFLDNLRTLVRKTDEVFLLHHTFYFILRAANLQGGAIVQARLWDALLWRVHNAGDGEIVRPRSMTIGHSAYPIPYDHPLQCIEEAQVPSLCFDVQPEKSTRELCTHAPLENDLPALARQLGIPYLALLPRNLPTQLRHLVTPQLARELQCYPVGRERDTLTVAMLNPDDQQALARLRQETGMSIFPVLAPPQELQIALEQLV